MKQGVESRTRVLADGVSTYGGTQTIQRIDANSKPSRRASAREFDEQLNKPKEHDSIPLWISVPCEGYTDMQKPSRHL
jgi:hypothetical protein